MIPADDRGGANPRLTLIWRMSGWSTTLLPRHMRRKCAASRVQGRKVFHIAHEGKACQQSQNHDRRTHRLFPAQQVALGGAIQERQGNQQ